MISNFQERIIAILQGSPNGLTSNEIAERLGATAGNISSRLSKLAAYGIIGKVRYSRGGNVYRALTYEQAGGVVAGAVSKITQRPPERAPSGDRTRIRNRTSFKRPEGRPVARSTL